MAALLKLVGANLHDTLCVRSPANEKAFSFALAQAKEFGSDLILFMPMTRLWCGV